MSKRATKQQPEALELARRACVGVRSLINDARRSEPRGKRAGHMLALVRQLAATEAWISRLKRGGA